MLLPGWLTPIISSRAEDTSDFVQELSNAGLTAVFPTGTPPSATVRNYVARTIMDVSKLATLDMEDHLTVYSGATFVWGVGDFRPYVDTCSGMMSGPVFHSRTTT